MNSLKPKEDKDETSNANSDGTVKIKTELDDGQLKHTEDSTALKNAILGPQSAEPEPPPTVATESIPTVHSTKTDAINSGKSAILYHHVQECRKNFIKKKRYSKCD